MGFSIWHLLIVGAIVGVLFGPKPFQKAGTGVGEFWRNLKRGYEGKEDIEITAKKIPDQIDEKD
jgi:Sec-independent protein translocase protein TatA